MPSETSQSGIVLELAEEFLQRYRNGERPSLKEYIDRRPDLAAEIKEVFPAMALMENIALADESLEPASRERQRPEEALQQVGDFRIIRQVGHGGMGIVYEAEQVSLGRHVALKVLPQKMLLDERSKRRFEREAKAAAKLHHTNIVPVFGVGEQEGLPYYVMQFIQGLGLHEVLEELKRLQPTGQALRDVPTAAEPLPAPDLSAAHMARSLLTGHFEPAAEPSEPPKPSDSGSVSSSSINLPGQSDPSGRSAARKATYWQSVAHIGVHIAGALEHAHNQGILHRDIKPSNLLLDLRGNVWVTDFGLAKADDQQNLTHTGDILGTLRYMSPEAFEGKADARVDVYSLGLTLYEFLAFRPAFDEKERNRLIKQVTTAEPARLDRINPAAPRDLVTIIHKAIERDPAHRYPTANALAADLQRFLDDEPIRARRIAPVERLRRWCRRNPLVASLTAALVLVFLAGLAGITGKWQDAERQKDMAEAEAEKSRRLLYTSDMSLALPLWEAGNLGRARELLDRHRPQGGREDLRGFEWRYLWRLCQDGSLHTFRGHSQPVTAVAFSPDGTLLVSAGADSNVRFWDVAARRDGGAILGYGAGVTSLAFSPDGKTLATASNVHSVRLWDVASRQEVGHLPVEGWNIVLAFSPNGRLLASLDRSGKAILLWDVATRQEVGALLGHTDLVLRVVFSPDGKTLASGGRDATVALWDVDARRRVAKLEGHTSWVDDLAFSPDGRTLASAGIDAKVYLWDTATRQGVPLRGDAGKVQAVAFSPDGKLLATGGGSTVRLWDAATREVLATLRGHTAAVEDLAFSPDGKTLATAGADRAVKLWRVAAGPDPDTLTGHTAWVHSVAFSPDGRRLVSGSFDRTVRVWEVAPRRQAATFDGHEGPVWCVAFAPGGETMASSGGDNTARLWDAAAKEQVAEFRHEALVVHAAFSPDGKLLAAGDWSDTVRVWDLATRREAVRFKGSMVQFTPDGTLLANRLGKIIQLWDVAAWRPTATLTGHEAEVWSLAFSPDGKFLASGSQDTSVRLWDLAAGREAALLKGHTQGVYGVAFSPDGKTLASGGSDGLIKLWNLLLRQEVATLRGHRGPVTSVTFSPDGTLLASSGGDATVRLWPAAPFQETDGR